MANQGILVHNPIRLGGVLRRISQVKNKAGPITHQILPTTAQNIPNLTLSPPKPTLDLPILPFDNFHCIAVPMPLPSAITIGKASNIRQFERIVIVQVKLSDQIATIEILTLIIVFVCVGVFIGKIVADELLVGRVKSATRRE